MIEPKLLFVCSYLAADIEYPLLILSRQMSEIEIPTRLRTLYASIYIRNMYIVALHIHREPLEKKFNARKETTFWTVVLSILPILHEGILNACIP